MAADALVYVVDDDAAVRDSLRWVIESAGWHVRACASAEEFLATYRAQEPGCLVLDVRMPGMGGLDLQKQLAERGIEVPIIFISAHGTVPAAVRALRAGAVDFIMKPFNNDALLARIEQCIALGRELSRTRAARAQVEARLALLTAREREVLEQVVAGKPNKLIATALDISIKTVEAHRAQVMDKMQAASLAELIRLVLSVRPARDPGKP